MTVATVFEQNDCLELSDTVSASIDFLLEVE